MLEDIWSFLLHLEKVALSWKKSEINSCRTVYLAIGILFSIRHDKLSIIYTNSHNLTWKV